MRPLIEVPEVREVGGGLTSPPTAEGAIGGEERPFPISLTSGTSRKGRNFELQNNEPVGSGVKE